MFAALVAGILAAAAFAGISPAVWAVCCGVCFATALVSVALSHNSRRPASPRRPAPYLDEGSHPVLYEVASSTSSRAGRLRAAGSRANVESQSPRLVAWVYAALAVVFFGAFAGRVSAPQSVVPQGVRLSLEVELEQTPTWRGGRAMHTSGRLISFSPIAQPTTTTSSSSTASASLTSSASPAPSSPASPVFASGERLLVAFDTMYRFSLGDRIRFVGYVNPIDSLSGSYARLMHARGFTGRTYVSRERRSSFALRSSSSPSVLYEAGSEGRYFFKNLQSAATARLAQLGLRPDAQAVAAAMTTGSRAAAPSASDPLAAAPSAPNLLATAASAPSRSGFSPELRRSYSRTGASHLLAVSGLHVGIIFLIINGLLYLLPLVRGGRAIKNVLAVAAIWTYAAVTGMSASVMRAAVMFSGAQVAVALGATRSAANILCGAAVILLAVSPGLIFDVSFQLSFLAVWGIMCWFSTIYRLVESRWRALNFLWSTLIVGFTASLATMPLVSHIFGVVSPLGVLLNPILMITAWVVVVFSAVWILLPFGFWAPLFRWLIDGAAGAQNAVIQRVSEIPGVAIDLRLSMAAVCAIYAALIMLTALVNYKTGVSRSRQSPRLAAAQRETAVF